MLALNDLINFSSNYVDSRANLEASIIVANDTDVRNLTEDLANSNNNCTLITLVPSHDSAIINEDAQDIKNNIVFMIVKKTDITAGNESMLNNFSICQSEIAALLKEIISRKDSPDSNCLFKDLDFTNTPITPLASYFGQNGYMLQVYTKTNL